MNNSITVYDLRRAIDGADDMLPVSLVRVGNDHKDPVAVFARCCKCAPRRDGLVIEIEDEALEDALDEADSFQVEISEANEKIKELKAELAKLKQPAGVVV